MVRIKPEFDGSDSKLEDNFYDGPPPTPGTYRGKIKKMGLAKIGSGENKGGNRIALVLEITDGKFKGAGVMHSLNMTKQGAPFVNQFLEALTDGSDAQRAGIRNAFWNIGFDVDPEPTGKMGQQFLKIGKKTNPIGMSVAFVTKMGNDLQDNPRAEVARFVLPIPKDSEDEDEDEDTLGAVTETETSSPVAAEEVSEAEADITDLDDDGDDPWA